MNIEKELRQYQKTKAFAIECQKKRKSFFEKYDFLPDDLTIEQIVLVEKRQELEKRTERK